MPPTTEQVLDALTDLQTAAMPPGWRSLRADNAKLLAGLRKIRDAYTPEHVAHFLASATIQQVTNETN